VDQWIQRGVSAAAETIAPLSRYAAPEEGFESSAIKRRFVQAGIQHPDAARIYFGGRVALFVSLPVLVGLLQWMGSEEPLTQAQFTMAGMAGVIGYFLPVFLLNRRVARRQQEIFEAFPDAVDLVTVCVEAGMGLDAALLRVAEEMSVRSRTLAAELEMVNVELRAGVDRERALRNLGFRTGVEEVDSFASLVVQAERFGTSVGNALRIQSDILRTRRQQRAEEHAAKIGTKLMMPMMLCLFPALMIVLVGPAISALMTSFSAFR
jgi:tight adherence protein C